MNEKNLTRDLYWGVDWLVAVRELLQKFEWSHDEFGWVYCSVCYARRDLGQERKGHTADCAMWKVLTDTPGSVEKAFRDLERYREIIKMATNIDHDLGKLRENLKQLVGGASHD